MRRRSNRHSNGYFQINLKAMFTLSEDDLKSIGVDDEDERTKILAFINDFSTPKKPNKLPSKVPLLRH